MSYIEIEKLSKSYDENEVLQEVNLKIEKGRLVTLLGPSGCGKTTLLRCLAGLEEAQSGSILMDGREITHLSPRERGIGMVFQQYSLFPNMNVAKNVAFGLERQKVPRDEIEKRVGNILEIVDLADHRDKYPSQLSGGQQQRAALARALVTGPKVLLLDEPLSAIDALLRHNLQIEIRRIQRKLNITTVFVTHDQDEAMVMSDRIHLMNGGRIVQSGSPMEMYTRPENIFAANFIGNYNIFTEEEFAVLSGAREDCASLAIRPELVRISLERGDAREAYHLTGTLLTAIPHGNYVRYEVRCNGIMVNADYLSAKIPVLPEERHVYLSIERDSLIRYDAQGNLIPQPDPS